MNKVEQITLSGKIVLDFDTILSRKDISSLLRESFPDVVYERGGFVTSIEGNKITLFVKNITYLGYPHPSFKKRIQVPASWRGSLERYNTFLVGVYKHGDNVLFVLFDKKRRGKNSSAHVYSIDLLKATESKIGIFKKVDKNGNTVIVCRKSFLPHLLEKMIVNERVEYSEEISLFEDFFTSMSPNWNGISAYREMIAADFRNKFQSEWPGWYLEFNFESFLKSRAEYEEICRYVQKKKNDDLDFDLDFLKSNFVGDLKTHADSSTAILGNDKKSVNQAIKKYKKIWYITFVFSYRMDKDFDCEVSRFWNSEQNKTSQNMKKEETSYCQKMKHDGVLHSVYILEINSFNAKYLSDFNQGKQQRGGAPREVKIKIDKKLIDNFVIFRKSKT